MGLSAWENISGQQISNHTPCTDGEQTMVSSRSENSILSTVDYVSDVGYLSSSETLLVDTPRQHCCVMSSPRHKVRVGHMPRIAETLATLMPCRRHGIIHTDIYQASQKETACKRNKTDTGRVKDNVKHFRIIPETQISCELGESNPWGSSTLRFPHRASNPTISLDETYSSLASNPTISLDETYSSLVMNLESDACPRGDNSIENKTELRLNACPHLLCHSRSPRKKCRQALQYSRKSKSDLSILYYRRDRNDSHFGNYSNAVTNSIVKSQHKGCYLEPQAGQKSPKQKDKPSRLITNEHVKSTHLLPHPTVPITARKKQDVKSPNPLHAHNRSLSGLQNCKKSHPPSSSALVKKAHLKCITDKSTTEECSHPAVSRRSEKWICGRRMFRLASTSSTRLGISLPGAQRMNDHWRRHSRVPEGRDMKNSERRGETSGNKAAGTSSGGKNYTESESSTSDKHVQRDQHLAISNLGENTKIKRFNSKCPSKCYNAIYKETLEESLRNRESKKYDQRDNEEKKERESVSAVPSETCQILEVQSSDCSDKSNSLTDAENILKELNSVIMEIRNEPSTTTNEELSSGVDIDPITNVQKEVEISRTLSEEPINMYSLSKTQLRKDIIDEFLRGSNVDNPREISEIWYSLLKEDEVKNQASLETNVDVDVLVEAKYELTLQAQENPCTEPQNETKDNSESKSQTSQEKSNANKSLHSFIQTQRVSNREEAGSSNNPGGQVGTKFNDIVRSVLSYLGDKGSDLQCSDQVTQSSHPCLLQGKTGRLSSRMQYNSPKTVDDLSLEPVGSTSTQGISSIGTESSASLKQSTVSNKLAMCFSHKMDSSLMGLNYLETIDEFSTQCLPTDMHYGQVDIPSQKSEPSVSYISTASPMNVNETKQNYDEDPEENTNTISESFCCKENDNPKVNVEIKLKYAENVRVMIDNEHKDETNVNLTEQIHQNVINTKDYLLSKSSKEKIPDARFKSRANLVNLTENQPIGAVVHGFKPKQMNTILTPPENFKFTDKDIQQTSTFSMQLSRLKDTKRRFGRQGSEVFMTGSDTSLSVLKKVSQPSTTIRRYQPGRFTFTAGHNVLEVNREKEKISCRCAAIHSILTDLKHHILLDRISEQKYGSTSQYMPAYNSTSERRQSSEPSESAKSSECLPPLNRPSSCMEQCATPNSLPKELPLQKSKESDSIINAARSEHSASNVTQSVQLIASIIKENAISPSEVLKALGFDENQITIAKRDSFSKKTKNKKRSFIENYCHQLIKDWQKSHTEDKTNDGHQITQDDVNHVTKAQTMKENNKDSGEDWKNREDQSVSKLLSKSSQYDNHVSDQYCASHSQLKGAKVKTLHNDGSNKHNDEKVAVHEMERFDALTNTFNKRSPKVAESKDFIHFTHRFRNMSTRELLEFALCNRNNDNINKLIVREVYKRASRKQSGKKDKSRLRQGALQLFSLLSKKSIESQSESLEIELCPEVRSRENSLIWKSRKVEQSALLESKREENKESVADQYSIMKEEFKERVKENQRIINQWSFSSLRKYRAVDRMHNEEGSKLKVGGLLYKPTSNQEFAQPENKRPFEDSVSAFKRTPTKRISSSTSPDPCEASGRDSCRDRHLKTPTKNLYSKMNNWPDAKFTSPLIKLSNKKCNNTEGVAVCYLTASDRVKEVKLCDPKVDDDTCKDNCKDTCTEGLKTPDLKCSMVAPDNPKEIGSDKEVLQGNLGLNTSTELTEPLGESCDKQIKSILKATVWDERTTSALRKSGMREEHGKPDLSKLKGHSAGKTIVPKHCAIQPNHETSTMPSTNSTWPCNRGRSRVSKKTSDMAVGHDSIRMFVDASVNTDSCDGQTKANASRLEDNKNYAINVRDTSPKSASIMYGHDNKVANGKNDLKASINDDDFEQIVNLSESEKETGEKLSHHGTVLNSHCDKNVTGVVILTEPMVDIKCAHTQPAKCHLFHPDTDQEQGMAPSTHALITDMDQEQGMTSSTQALTTDTDHVQGLASSTQALVIETDQEQGMASSTKALLTDDLVKANPLTSVEVRSKTCAVKIENGLASGESNQCKDNNTKDGIGDQSTMSGDKHNAHRLIEEKYGLGLPVLSKSLSLQEIGNKSSAFSQIGYYKNDTDQVASGQIKEADCGERSLLGGVNDTIMNIETSDLASRIKDSRTTMVYAPANETNTQDGSSVCDEMKEIDHPSNKSVTDVMVDGKQRVGLLIEERRDCGQGAFEVAATTMGNSEELKSERHADASSRGWFMEEQPEIQKFRDGIINATKRVDSIQADTEQSIAFGNETYQKYDMKPLAVETHNLDDTNPVNKQCSEKKTTTTEEIAITKYFLNDLHDTCQRCRVEDNRYRVQDNRYSLEDSQCRVEDILCRVEDTQYRVKDNLCRVEDNRYRVEDSFVNTFNIENKIMESFVIENNDLNFFTPSHLEERMAINNGELQGNPEYNPADSAEQPYVMEIIDQCAEQTTHFMLRSELTADTLSEESHRSVDSGDTVIIIEETPEEGISLREQCNIVFSRPQPQPQPQFISDRFSFSPGTHETCRSHLISSSGRPQGLEIVPKSEQLNAQADAIQELPEISSAKRCPPAYLEHPRGDMPREVSCDLNFDVNDASSLNGDISHAAKNYHAHQGRENELLCSKVEPNGKPINPFRMAARNPNGAERYKYIQYVSPIVHTIQTNNIQQAHHMTHQIEPVNIHGQQVHRVNPIQVNRMNPVSAINFQTDVATALPRNQWKPEIERISQASIANVYGSQVVKEYGGNSERMAENTCVTTNEMHSMQSTQLLGNPLNMMDTGSMQGYKVNTVSATNGRNNHTSVAQFTDLLSSQVTSAETAYIHMNQAHALISDEMSIGDLYNPEISTVTMRSPSDSQCMVYGVSSNLESNQFNRDEANPVDCAYIQGVVSLSVQGVVNPSDNASLYHNRINYAYAFPSNVQYNDANQIEPVQKQNQPVRQFHSTHMPNILTEQMSVDYSDPTDRLYNLSHLSLTNKNVDHLTPTCLSHMSYVNQVNPNMHHCNPVNPNHLVSPLHRQFGDQFKVNIPNPQVNLNTSPCILEDSGKLSPKYGIGTIKADMGATKREPNNTQFNVISKRQLDRAELTNSDSNSPQNLLQNTPNSIPIKKAPDSSNSTEVKYYVNQMLQRGQILQSDQILKSNHQQEWANPQCFYVKPNSVNTQSKSEAPSTSSQIDTYSLTAFYSESSESSSIAEQIPQLYSSQFSDSLSIMSTNRVDHLKNPESQSDCTDQLNESLFDPMEGVKQLDKYKYWSSGNDCVLSTTSKSLSFSYDLVDNKDSVDRENIDDSTVVNISLSLNQLSREESKAIEGKVQTMDLIRAGQHMKFDNTKKCTSHGYEDNTVEDRCASVQSRQPLDVLSSHYNGDTVYLDLGVEAAPSFKYKYEEYGEEMTRDSFICSCFKPEQYPSNPAYAGVAANECFCLAKPESCVFGQDKTPCLGDNEAPSYGIPWHNGNISNDFTERSIDTTRVHCSDVKADEEHVIVKPSSLETINPTDTMVARESSVKRRPVTSPRGGNANQLHKADVKNITIFKMPCEKGNICYQDGQLVLRNQSATGHTANTESVKQKLRDIASKTKRYVAHTSPTALRNTMSRTMSACREQSTSESDRQVTLSAPQSSPKFVGLQSPSIISELKKIFTQDHSPGNLKRNDNYQSGSSYKSRPTSNNESLSMYETSPYSNRSPLLKGSSSQKLFRQSSGGHAADGHNQPSKPQVPRNSNVTDGVDHHSRFLKHTLSSSQKMYVTGSQTKVNQSASPRPAKQEPQTSGTYPQKAALKLKSLCVPVVGNPRNNNEIPEKFSESQTVTSNSKLKYLTGKKKNPETPSVKVFIDSGETSNTLATMKYGCVLSPPAPMKTERVNKEEKQNSSPRKMSRNDDEMLGCDNITTRGMSEKTPTLLQVPGRRDSKASSPTSLSASLSSNQKRSGRNGSSCTNGICVVNKDPIAQPYSNVACLKGASESSSERTIKSTYGINGEDSSSADELDSADEALEIEKVTVKRPDSCSLSDSFHSCNSVIQ